MKRRKDSGAEDGEDAAVHVTEEAQQKHGYARGPLAERGLGWRCSLDFDHFVSCLVVPDGFAMRRQFCCGGLCTMLLCRTASPGTSSTTYQESLCPERARQMRLRYAPDRNMQRAS